MRVLFTKEDWAKYPFLPGASRYISELGLDIREDLPELPPVLERAEERVREAIVRGRVDAELREEDVEILSFPVAVALVSAVGDDYLTRRYALAEAVRVHELLVGEREEKLLGVAEALGWRVKRVEAPPGAPAYRFAVHLLDYLRNAVGFHDRRWKLVNRLVHRGEVYVSQGELARLLMEDVRRWVESRVKPEVRGAPEVFMESVNRIRGLLAERRAGFVEEVPRGVYPECFPPCIRSLYEALTSKRHISHVGRFTLTSFLLNVGMSPQEVVRLFASLTDFDERITRYQVEHIAGRRGSRTKYTPPKCETLRTHGLCVGEDELCRRVKHPLTYYRRKLKGMKRRGD